VPAGDAAGALSVRRRNAAPYSPDAPAEHKAADLLRHQSFTVGRELTDAELFSPKLADVLARDYARLVPFVRWFNAALGLRTLARR